MGRDRFVDNESNITEVVNSIPVVKAVVMDPTNAEGDDLLYRRASCARDNQKSAKPADYSLTDVILYDETPAEVLDIVSPGSNWLAMIPGTSSVSGSHKKGRKTIVFSKLPPDVVMAIGANTYLASGIGVLTPDEQEMHREHGISDVFGENPRYHVQNRHR